jgi:hypothetical protein
MKRLKEPSTWAGFGVLFQVLKAFVPPQYGIVLDGLSGVAAAVAGVVPETAK